MPDVATISPLLEPRHRDLADAVVAFCDDQIRSLPPADTDAGARGQARHLLGLLGEGGWYGYAVPEAWGGRPVAPDLRACCLIREALAAASPLADAVFALQCLGSLPIVLAGSDAQCEEWLPEVIAGRAMAAFAMTEAEAGSDVSAMATRARRDADEYTIAGEKSFISNAGIADFYVVFAATGDASDGRQPISCFVVPSGTAGLELAEAQRLSAPHPLGRMVFDGCRVPATARLGEEGEGFRLGMRTLDRLRPTVAAAACGMASRALDEALTHARHRRQFGRRLGDFQLIQDKLARMATELAAARLLTYRAAAAADAGASRITIQASMAKAFATEAAQRIVDEAVQILGGRGVLADHPLDRLYRSVRALRIYEGTTEIQRLVIARELLREG